MSIELQNIDTNCNNCIHLIRDIDKYYKWMKIHKIRQYLDFRRNRENLIKEAKEVIELGVEVKSGEGQLRQALKMKYQFEKRWLLSYGHCEKLNKKVSFLPDTCDINNSNCFENRRTQ